MILNKKLENYWLILLSLPLWECGLKSVLPKQYSPCLLSLPLWECGLKSLGRSTISPPFSVAPFVGVWIEIIENYIMILLILSLPLWECGLKSPNKVISTHIPWSLPLWECGLKYLTSFFCSIVSEVAPFVGVWIEIRQ